MLIYFSGSSGGCVDAGLKGLRLYMSKNLYFFDMMC
jgi:hypothetical protein